MIPFYKRSQEEQLALVEQAVEGDVAPLKDALSPLVREIAQRYADSEQIEAAVEAGLEAVPTAARLYLADSVPAGESYKFSTYFTWFARRAIEVHLGLTPTE